MGYTHYWYRAPELDQATFIQAVQDFKTILPKLEAYGVKLGNGLGKDVPVINEDAVLFNGLEDCGHPANESIVIPWPSAQAGGVGQSETAEVGTWFAGTEVITRCCNGDCSYETFHFPRVFQAESWMIPENGKFFDCTKTAFRPYDLAVTAFLVIAKHHFGDGLTIRSDGDDVHWFDAKMLCQMELGYGMTFKID